METNKELYALLCCPDCHSSLIPSTNILHCTKCNRDWNVVNKNPIFWNYHRNNSFSDKVWSEINQIATLSGWKEILKKYPENSPDFRPESSLVLSVNESITNFQYFMDLNQKSTVLTVWDGWGNISTDIAPNVARVISLGMHLFSSDFIRIRASQESIENIQTAVGSPIKLPLFSESIDAILFQDVLEWIPYLEPKYEPEVIQLKVLKEAYRILKQKGLIYICIENKLDYLKVFGARDPHNGKRFSFVYPRAYRGSKHNYQPQAFTHSYWSLLKLLEQAGFEILSFSHYPIINRGTYQLLSSKSNQEIDFYILNRMKNVDPKKLVRSIISFFMIAASLSIYFAPRFSVIAQKNKYD